MESNDPLIGKELGTCVLDRVVGSGGMGMVYLAHQTRPVRDVAVKVLRSGAGIYTEAHKEFLERFRREANVIARLDHVNILPIYGYDEQDGLAYLVMPYLTGGSLRTLLLDRGKISPQEALTYIEQAGSALQYAHEHQIVHRDIKPANMLFHADGRLVLVDFGIARITHDGGMNEISDVTLTAAGQFLGSAEYMAPEMVQGHNVDYRADLYELGIVLFQMLTGRVPFQGSTVLSIAAMHINETPHSLTLLEPTIPRSLDLVVQKVLSKKPEDRYNSAREFVDAVRTAINSSGVLSQNSNNYTRIQSAPLASAESQSSPFVRNVQETQLQSEPYTHADPSFYTPATVSNGGSSSNPLPANTSSLRQNTSYVPSTHNSQNFSSLNTFQGNVATPFNAAQPGQISNEAYGHHEPRKPKKSRVGLAWLCAICILIILCIVGIVFVPSLLGSFQLTITDNSIPTPQATVSVTPTPTAAEQAQAVIQLYYDDINKADYQSAYAQLSAASQKRQSYATFEQGYMNTKEDVVTYTSTDTLTDGTYRCNVDLATTEVDSNKLVHKMFTGYYVVGPDGNHGLKILPGTQMLPKS